MAGQQRKRVSSDACHALRNGGVIDLCVDVARSEVLRLLGYGGESAPRESVGTRIESLVEQAGALVRPLGAARRICERDARLIGMPSPEGGGWAAVVTVGAGLEEEAARLQEDGDLLGGLILDACGSAAAECAAEALDLLIRDEARRLGFGTRRRVSPGYGSWDVARQADLLALLPMEKLGMRLTEGMMMVPRKSVSFVTGAAGGVEPRQDYSGCARCGDADTCRYRRGR